MSCLPRRALDSPHDALIGAAAADICVHVLDNLVARRIWLLLEEISGAHDLARLAVAALGTCSASHAFCSGWLESGDRPSIVVIDLPATSETWVWQENARLPSICTMQAPH